MTVAPGIGMPLAELARRVVGRTDRELFREDVEVRRPALEEAVTGRRVLVIGGGGSIGAATVAQLVDFRPGAVHVIDLSENALAELVRDLRSRPEGLPEVELRTLPLDAGSPLTRRFLREGGGYDLVLDFAALKHVRSEKDVFSLLRMLDTNVLGPARLVRWLGELDPPPRLFCVSTDKAADPVSLMGASKRIMEHVLFSGEVAADDRIATSSARFANVAFSDGSLLDSFLRRLRKGQPLAAPRDTRRFFVTQAEAGRLCLLAATLGPPRHLVVPRIASGVTELELEEVARLVLDAHGLTPEVYDREEEARRGVERDLPRGRYPLLLTDRDTSGEKPGEIFAGAGEEIVEIGFRELTGVPYRRDGAEALGPLLQELEELTRDSAAPATKEAIVEAMARVVPELRHLETGRGLDERM